MKRKFYSFIFIACLFSIVFINGRSYAQNPTFRKSYDVTLFDIAGGMVQSNTGDFLFAGGGIQAILTCVDDTGIVKWSKNYNSGFVAQFNDIKKVSTGGYILCGSSSSNGAILTRVDVNGNLIWSMKYQYPDKAGKSSNEYANAVIETSDGGFLVGGGVDYFWDGISANTIDTASAMGFKVDASGNLLWNIVWPLTNTTKADEHYINDVAESADGYFFVGESADETQSYDSDGDLPRDALIIKTNKTGTTQYIRRWGHSNSTSQGINSAITLTTGANAGKILLGGYDDIHAFLITLDGTGGTPTLGAFNRRINGSAIGYTYILTDIMENPDGNYSFMGTRLAFLSVGLNTMICKINSSTSAWMFGKSYAPIGLSSLLPRGGIASDGGYFTSQLDQQVTGFNFNVIRADASGNIGSAATGCVPTDFTPGMAAYAPALSTPVSAEYTSMTASSTTPVITNVSVTQTLHCLACIPPAVANNVTASPNPICPGGSTTITASGTASGVHYTVYTTASGGSSLGTSPLSVSPGGTTTYYIETVSNADASCVSSSRATVTVTVNPLPSSMALNNGPVCVGSPIILSGGSAGMTSYSWSGPNSYSSTLQNPTVSSNATLAMAGTYTLTVSDGTCSNTASTIVVVNSIPTATASNNGPVCAGSTLTLTGGANGLATYSWSGPNSFSSTSQNPTVSASATLTMAGIYTITVSDGTCSNTTSTSVTINPLPNPNLGANVGTCVGHGITITASGGGTYAWSPVTDLSCITCANPVATPSDTTTYTVTVTDGNGCSNTDNITVNVYNTPTANAGPDTATCRGTAITLSASGGSNYSWSPATGLNSVTVSNPSANPTNTTIYIVTVSDVSGCSAVDTVVVTVNPLPVADAGPNVVICPGASTTLNAAGGTAYSWSPASGLSSTTMNNPVATPVSTTTYTVTVSNANGCKSTDNVTVTVSAPTANAGADVAICQGAATTLSASGGSSYSWSPATGLSSVTVSSPVANPTSTTTYVVTASNSNGCTATDNVKVTVNPAPTADAGTDAAICNGSSVTLGASGGTSYSWSPSTGLSSVTASNPVADPASTTMYTVTVTNTFGCTDNDNVTITVNALPVANAGADQDICLGGSATLTATGGGSYAWNTGDNTATVSYTPSVTTTYVVTVTYANGCSSSDNVIVSVTSMPSVTLSAAPPDYAYTGQVVTFTAYPPGYDTYNFYVDNVLVQSGSGYVYQTNSILNGQAVSVSASDNTCLSLLDTMTYEVKPIPNAFTPYDIDNKNDIFVAGLDLKIFNRWGQLLYDGNAGWDGKYQGTLVAPGTYFYVIAINDISNALTELHGSVTVIGNK